MFTSDVKVEIIKEIRDVSLPSDHDQFTPHL
jgi:hypothetical protein